MDTRDLSIISQNAGSTAASLVNAADNTGKSPLDLLDEFVSIRDAVFNGTLDHAGTNRGAVIEQIDKDAAARVQASFNKQATPSAAAVPTSGSSTGRVKILKQLEQNGQKVPAPEWLSAQVEWLVGKGEIPDTSEIELWDNRSFLVEFGGNREKGSQFVTKWKADGEKWGVSIWAPKKAAR